MAAAATVSEALLLNEVPVGFKFKPQVRTGANTISGALKNFGEDLKATLFFTDLEDVPREEEKDEQPNGWGWDIRPQPQPRRRLKLTEMVFPEVDDAITSDQAKAMYMTIPPPVIDRIKNIDDKRKLKTQQAAVKKLLNVQKTMNP